jgi:hypothetical protein
MPKNALHVEFLVLCDNALLSKDNKLSLIGIFDSIVTDSMPFNFPKMALVAVVSGQPHSTHDLFLIITSPEGKPIVSLNIKVTLGASGNSNLISDLANFPLETTGEYRISLSQNKKEITSKTFTVSRTSSKPPFSS